jgi:hypothetical protein
MLQREHLRSTREPIKRQSALDKREGELPRKAWLEIVEITARVSTSNSKRDRNNLLLKLVLLKLRISQRFKTLERWSACLRKKTKV